MRALITGDQPLIVYGLHALLSSLEARDEVSCADSLRAARLILSSDPGFDLVLLDLALEKSADLAFLSELRNTCPDTSIVVLSEPNSNELVGRAIGLGARGFLSKRDSIATVAEALHRVMSGLVYVPPMKRSPSIPRSAEKGCDREGDDPRGPTVENRLAARELAAARGLTARQTDVLELLLLGHSNKAIARALKLSVDTVKDHVSSLLRRLEMTSRTQVVLWWVRQSGRESPPTAQRWATIAGRSVGAELATAS